MQDLKLRAEEVREFLHQCVVPIEKGKALRFVDPEVSASLTELLRGVNSSKKAEWMLEGIPETIDPLVLGELVLRKELEGGGKG